MKMGKYKKEINDINRLSLKRKYTLNFIEN